MSAARLGAGRRRRRPGRRMAVAVALATGVGLAIGVAMARPPSVPRLLGRVRLVGIADTEDTAGTQRRGPS